jgi:hypothetical protein
MLNPLAFDTLFWVFKPDELATIFLGVTTSGQEVSSAIAI